MQGYIAIQIEKKLNTYIVSPLYFELLTILRFLIY